LVWSFVSIGVSALLVIITGVGCVVAPTTLSGVVGIPPSVDDVMEWDRYGAAVDVMPPDEYAGDDGEA